jgi:hypothetical protein
LFSETQQISAPWRGQLWSFAGSVLTAALVCACATPDADGSPGSRASEPTPDAASEGVPFTGARLGDDGGEGAVVLGMVAGPAARAGLRQGDRIVRIGGDEVDAAQAEAMIAASRPGAQLDLDIVREAATFPLALVLDSRERWAGPASYAAAVPFARSGISDGSTALEAMVQVLGEAPDAAPISRRLDQMFQALARDDAGYHKLPLIRAALMQSGGMPAWRDGAIARLQMRDDGRALIEFICQTLALDCRQASIRDDAVASLADFVAPIARGNEKVRQAFIAAGSHRQQASADVEYLLTTTAADRTLLAQAGAIRGVQAMQLSMRVDLSVLLAVAGDLLANTDRLPALPTQARKLPAELAALVEGDILDYVEVGGGYAVVGGIGPNRYRMERLYAVIDAGGSDVYLWRSAAVPGETQTIVDLGGDDRYLASRAGPGAGWLGAAVLVDHAGNDQYESGVGGCGAGVLGFGFLLDEGGTDHYRCAAWSAGSGFYGAGILLDKGPQSDAYLSEVFSQGVGGPRGFGALADESGAELYRANGPVPSAYGIPATFMAFSQGVGVGIRPYDYGGVGVLLDFDGDDRYEGGEFSQGGGYFWGVGVLHDQSGNDLYYGNRYAQGFAAHQAFGMLSDVRGDDSYWSSTAAGQAAAWDQSVAVLIEGGGNDVYHGAWLSQGAAAEQARAALLDLGGDDVYWSSRDVSQGAAGGNSYHLREDDPVYSLGALLDQGGADRYSSGLINGRQRLRLVTTDPRTGRGVAGVAVDREQQE